MLPQQTARDKISIHALREEGDLASWSLHPRYLRISIHALREEGDVQDVTVGTADDISIHALREEGDSGGQGPRSEAGHHFYPRPP